MSYPEMKLDSQHRSSAESADRLRHDLRSHLSAIVSGGQVLKRRLGDNEDADFIVGQIIKNAMDAADLVARIQ